MRKATVGISDTCVLSYIFNGSDLHTIRQTVREGFEPSVPFWGTAL